MLLREVHLSRSHSKRWSWLWWRKSPPSPSAGLRHPSYFWLSHFCYRRVALSHASAASQILFFKNTFKVLNNFYMILYIIKRLAGHAPSSIYCQGVQLIVVGLLFSKLICVFFSFFFLRWMSIRKSYRFSLYCLSFEHCCISESGSLHKPLLEMHLKTCTSSRTPSLLIQPPVRQ